MKKTKFEIPGHPVGYKTTTRASKYNKAYQGYVEYKKVVQLYAKAAGLRLPLKATKDNQVMIRTVSYFKTGRHPDPENVNKGVRDALFYNEVKLSSRSTGKGDDKHTGGSFDPPKYSDKPRVVVIVNDYTQTKEKSLKSIKKAILAMTPEQRDGIRVLLDRLADQGK